MENKDCLPGDSKDLLSTAVDGESRGFKGQTSNFALFEKYDIKGIDYLRRCSLADTDNSYSKQTPPAVHERNSIVHDLFVFHPN